MKKLLTLALALAMVCVCALAAAEMGPTLNFKLAENQPDGNPITEGMKMFAELANKYTEGTVTIDVYANGAVVGKDFTKHPGLHKTMLGDGLACTLAAFLGGAPVTTYSEVTGAVSLTKVTDPSCMRIAALSAILISLVGKVGAAIQTIPTAVLGGIMLLLFGSIASVGINNLVKAKVDMNKTRNLIIASLILTIGIGGAVISFGKFSLAGIGLASVVGVILNLVIPDRNEPEEVNA